MKALSIHGNYIMDIIRGRKTIEYRTWKTNYRGEILLCASAKKYAGGIHGYAACVAKINHIEWSEEDECYHWHIEPFKEGGSYLIKPIKVKGQLKLFNVDDDLIKKAPFDEVNFHNPDFQNWWNDNLKPLIWFPKNIRRFRIKP